MIPLSIRRNQIGDGTDPYWDKVILSLPMADAADDTTYTDVSNSPLTVLNTDVIQKEDQTLFTLPTAKFNGSSYLRIESIAATNLYPAGTVEFFFWSASAADDIILIYNGIYGSNEPWSIIWTGGTTNKFLSTQSLGTAFYSNEVVGGFPTSQWNHIALCGQGSWYEFFLNGVSIGSRNTGESFPDQQSDTWIGDTSFSTTALTGYMANLRITKGVRRYTSNFDVPAAAFPTA